MHASCIRVVDAEDVTIATVHNQPLDPPELLPANARLIATAPDLLAQCKYVLMDAEQMAEDPDVGLHWDWALTVYELRTLIAKAT